MDWDSWWTGFLWGICGLLALVILIFLINIDRVRLYNYENMQQTCVVYKQEILRCYATESE